MFDVKHRRINRVASLVAALVLTTTFPAAANVDTELSAGAEVDTEFSPAEDVDAEGYFYRSGCAPSYIGTPAATSLSYGDIKLKAPGNSYYSVWYDDTWTQHTRVGTYNGGHWRAVTAQGALNAWGTYAFCRE